MAGANIRVGANSSDFQKQMKDVTRQLKLVSSECGVAAEKAKLFGNSQDKLAIAQKEATAKIQAQNQMLSIYKERIAVINADIQKHKDKQSEIALKIDETTKKYKQSVEQTGKNSDASKALNKELQDLKEKYAQNEKAIDGSSKKLVDATTKMNNTEIALLQNKKALENINKEINNSNIDKLAEGFDKAGDKVTNAGKKMSVVSAGIVGVGTASVAAFNAVDDGADNVLKATGAVGEAAKELDESYKNVASNIVGDFGSIGSALGEVNTRFGFTGSELETCTEQFMKFSEITGTDATSAVQLVSRAMGDAGIDSSEYGNVLDSLAVAAQASGIGIDRLTENITKYGAPMRALGYDTKESIAIFASWEKAGVNTEIAFSGMKTAIGNWGKEGKDARQEFKKTIDEIAACPDIAEATSKSIEIFGQKAGPDLADAIQGGRFEFEEMLKVIEGSGGTVDNTFDGLVDGGYEAELTMQNAKLALADVGDVILQTVAPIFKELTDKIKEASQWFSGLSDGTKKNIVMFLGAVAAIGPFLIILGSIFSAISKIVSGMKAIKTAFTAVKTIGSAVKAFALANPITLIILAIVAVIAIIATLYVKCEWFRDGVKAIFEALKTAWNTTLEFFKGLWDGFVAGWNAAIEGMKNIWNGICEFFKIIWDGVCLYFKTVWEFWKNFFQSVGEIIKGIWQGICNTVSGVWDGVVSGVKSAWEGIVTTFQNVVNSITSIWDGIKSIFKLPHFSITGKLSLNPPSIPKIGVDWYYTGAIFKTPTILNGVGIGDAFNGQGSKAEAVVPLDEMYRNIDRIIKQESANETTVYITVENNMDSETISKKTYKKVIKEVTRNTNNYKKSKGGGLSYA